MAYIHPNDKRIDEFIKDNVRDRSDINTVSNALLAWFDKNVEYSRLNAPFFPLQRSDLDVLSMRSGTCGDYSNLIVSVLLKLDMKQSMHTFIKIVTVMNKTISVQRFGMGRNGSL